MNLPHFKRLLEITYRVPNRTLAKKNPCLAHQINKIRVLGPLIRGEIALQVDKDLKTASECFSQAGRNIPNREPSTYWKNIHALLTLHTAEIQLGVYTDTIALHPQLLNESQSVERLLGLQKQPISTLRLAQYYLGFFGHKVKERMGLKKIAEAAAYREVSHLAYRIWAEYHLGITNPKACQIDRATELLERAFEACEGMDDLEAAIHLRRGEMALGLYEVDGGDLETGEASAQALPELNIPQAIDNFERIKPDADILLHRIYTGYYGEEYANPEAAQVVQTRLEATKSIFIRSRQAVAEYNQGNIARALEIFGDQSNTISGAYYLGRFKSNLSHPEFYNPEEAIEHFYTFLEYNFRDSKVRLFKLLLKKFNLSISPDFSLDSIDWLLNRMRSEKSIITKEEFQAHGISLLENDGGGKIASTSDATPAATVTQGTDGTCKTASVAADATAPMIDEDEGASDSSDELKTFLQAVQAVDETAPIRVLSDPNLQYLYESFSLGTVVRLSYIQNVVMAFNGTIKRNKKTWTIKLPHSKKVFTFHTPHDPKFYLTGYWANLKDMLDHEFNVRCQMEAEAGE